ncbi:glycosyltransferase family 4 protein [Leptolyngbya ohadii]|uniref:glycosyltransferase family 4 protein n=1 Tax=Leptolyngbya ohadii TaxID=1962290 RepID=UPI000B59F535|nr:glycosyltransferase family 4 protein [Leptolyngbya ohadii]
MNIAFISYEYPPDTALGGIATYVAQAARMLVQRGHHVEVFAAGDRSVRTVEAGIVVHRVVTPQRSDFSKAIAPIFAARHRQTQFDVLEATDIDAPARDAVQLVPDIALVVKLHTPTFLMQEISEIKPSLSQKLRWHLGTLRRGQPPRPYPRFHYAPSTDIERFQALDADIIAAPSIAIGEVLKSRWQLNADTFSLVPLPYLPAPELLAIPANTQTNTITFLGRLEIRKGVLDLAKAVPLILRQCPNAKFRFVGSAWNSPHRDLDMRQYLERQLYRYHHALEFTGKVSLAEIPSFLEKTDICVFPSLWESFGLVCLEAMAAARGVVGSSAGGMAEILQGEVGRLVPPTSPEQIAAAVVELLQNPALRMQLGQAARDRVLTEYSLERIGRMQEDSYIQAIQRRRAIDSRSKQVDSQVIHSQVISRWL